VGIPQEVWDKFAVTWESLPITTRHSCLAGAYMAIMPDSFAGSARQNFEDQVA